LRVLDQIFSKPEFVIPFDPGAAGARKDAAEGFEDAFSNRDFLQKSFAGPKREIKAGDLPKILKVAV